MKQTFLSLAFLATSLISAAACAGDIQISRATVRATAPGQETAMGDLVIESKLPAKLVGVSTPVAQSVELHRMSTDNGMMTMREVKDIELPAGKMVDLGESGYHLMLIGLKQPIKEGMAVPYTVTVRLSDKKSVKLEVQAQIKPLIETNGDMNAHEHMHMHHH